MSHSRFPLHLRGLLLVLVQFAGASLATAAPESFRLDRIGVTRFEIFSATTLVRREGTLHLDGRVHWLTGHDQPLPANFPTWAADRTLVRREDWFAYRRLGFGATANFQLGGGSAEVRVGDASYWLIGVAPDVRLSDGRVVNISTRLRLAAAGDTAIAGFVIEERHRWVLIRGVGPGLAAFGVGQPLADPIIGLRKGSLMLHVNDDWHTRHDAAQIRTAALAAGAFPLAEGGKDAALLVELPPGAYTVVVENAPQAGAGGEVLLEVYSVPEPQLD